jgi:hypothetical protein
MTVGLPGLVAESGPDASGPQSKTWRLLRVFKARVSVLECASPLALSVREQVSVK